MTANLNVIRQYIRLYYANQILTNSGGPEKQGELFEYEHNLMCEILQRHYLPPLQQYLGHLFDYCDRVINLDTCEAILEAESRKYLLSEPQVRKEILKAMLTGSTNIHNGLIEMNVDTYVYFIFICEAFCDGSSTIEMVLNDIRIIENKPILHEMLIFLQSSVEPQKTLLYKDLKASGISMIDRFLKIPEPTGQIRLSGLKLLSVTGFSNLECELLVQHEFYNLGKPFSIDLHITQLLNLTEAKIADFVIERVMANLMDKDHFVSYILTAEEFDEIVIIVATCYLAVNNPYGEFSDEFINYSLINLDPDENGQYLNIQNKQIETRGFFPPEEDGGLAKIQWD